MAAKLEVGAVTASQKAAQPAEMHLRALACEPWDSGFDSDEPTPFRTSLEVTDESSDEELLDNIIRDKMDQEAEPLKDKSDAQRDSLDIVIKWRQHTLIRQPSISESNETDRASPPLYEVELTASDEDDDASVLELVIPMQSRYQRVPTSSPIKAKPKNPTLLSTLFCCMRK